MTDVKMKLEADVKIRESASEAFHELFKNRPHHVSGIHPEFIQACNLHEGDFGQVGSVISWDYFLDGKPGTLKQEIVLIDEENKTMGYKCVGGDLFDEYKTFTTVLQVISKDSENCIVRWTFEYEKMEAGNRDPCPEMAALIELAQKIDDHHHSQNN